jgi:hypothetical protein
MSISIARLLPTCYLNFEKPETESFGTTRVSHVHMVRNEYPSGHFPNRSCEALALHINQTPTQEENVTKCLVSNLEINKPALTCSIFRNLSLTG